jgi:anaerobic magnesium-protoporphyrin IX monomethyl ester cyclase
MDVLLINPYDENAVKNSLGFITPPLNLLYLAGALESSMSVQIIDDDLMKMGIEKVSELASKIDPSVVGFTATTSNIKTALKYVESLKEVLPNSLSVIGGPHATFVPTETLKESPLLDVVVIGEGEETLTDLASKYCEKGHRNLDDVKGIVHRDIKTGNIKLNQPRPLIKDLNSIPFPARHLVPFESYGSTKDRTSDMITSRGCVYDCGYCSSSLVMGKKFRSRSPENVVDEIEELQENYQVKDIAFMDDTFMLNKRRANAIADEIKGRGLDIGFVASSRVDMVDKSLLKKLKSAGLSTLYYGVESGSQRVLNLMKKGITLTQAETAVKAAKDIGVEVLTSFILGFPGETPKEIEETINFSIKLDADYSQFSILTPFPGTPIYNELKEKKLIDTENWDKYTVLKSVIKYDELGLNKKMVERKLTKAYLKFYARPKYLLKHRHMLKVILEIVYRSFVLPKINGGDSKGWYQKLENETSTK